ncbi:MAG: hypothetical protein U5L01_00250 [Rheinheimera sp.]|nr:hypothetical protein [Rheinheimera sp.]
MHRLICVLLPDPTGNCVVLAVEDRGPGVPAALQQQIFQTVFYHTQ